MMLEKTEKKYKIVFWKTNYQTFLTTAKRKREADGGSERRKRAFGSMKIMKP
jgi:hypothetical protein